MALLCGHVACIPGSHRTVTIRETGLGRLPAPEHCTDSRLKHTSNLSVKEAYLLVLEFRLRGKLQVWNASRGQEVLSENTGQGMPSFHSLSALPQLAGTSQKRASALVWTPTFYNCPTEGFSRSPNLEASRTYDCGPMGLDIFVKAAA